MTEPAKDTLTTGEEGKKQEYVVQGKGSATPSPELQMTLKEAQDMNWSEEEIKLGQDQGIFKDPEKPKEGEEGKPKDGEGAPAGEGEGAGTKKEGEEGKPKEEGGTGGSGEDFLLTAEEEALLAEKVDKDPNISKKLKNVSAQYWGRKAAVSRAQAAEAERDRVLKENQEMKDRMAKLEERIDKAAAGEGGEEDPDDDKPLTKKEMLKIFSEREESARKKETDEKEKQQKAAEKIEKALKIQEIHARSVYGDYDDVVKAGHQLVKRDASGNFESKVNISNLPPHAQKRAMELLRQTRDAAARADEMTTSDYTAADLMYDLGKLAKEFLKPDTAGQSAERKSGGLTPEDEERIRRNKDRGSSASISGTGGKRVITVDNVTVDDLLAMDDTTFNTFQKNHPEKVDELMRG